MDNERLNELRYGVEIKRIFRNPRNCETRLKNKRSSQKNPIFRNSISPKVDVTDVLNNIMNKINRSDDLSRSKVASFGDKSHVRASSYELRLGLRRR